MTLECSVVIFQALEYVWPQWPQQPQQPQWPQWPRQLHFTKEITDFYVSINHGTKILVSQCGMDHQKPTILLIFGTLSLGGCWGHPMRQKLNLKDKCQISKPNEYTDKFKSNLTCIFLSVRAKLKKTLCPPTLCTTGLMYYYRTTIKSSLVQNIYHVAPFKFLLVFFLQLFGVPWCHSTT